MDYDDGDKETISLSEDSKQRFHWVDPSPSKKGGANGGGANNRGGVNKSGGPDSSNTASAKGTTKGTCKATKGKAAKGKAAKGKAAKGKAAKGEVEVTDKESDAQAGLEAMGRELLRTGAIDMDARSRSEKRQTDKALDESTSKRGRAQRGSKQQNPPPPPRQVQRKPSAQTAPKNRAMAQVCNLGRRSD